MIEKKLREIRENNVKIYDILYNNKTFTFVTIDEKTGIVTLHNNGVFIKKEYKGVRENIKDILDKL